MEISKLAVILANEHRTNQKKNVTKLMIFVKKIATYPLTQKRLCQWNARKFSIKEEVNQNGSLSIS